jgi:hypothetical protein
MHVAPPHDFIHVSSGDDSAAAWNPADYGLPPDWGEPVKAKREQARQQKSALDVWNAGEELKILPQPREWLLGNTFCRTFMSSLLADGGVGKTALRVAQWVACATAKQITDEYVFQRCRVLIISLEDNREELKRRILACCLHHRIDPAELDGWLYCSTPGALAGKLMTQDRSGKLTPGGLADALEAEIVDKQIDIASIDPFIKAHAVEENSNSAIDAVVQILTDLADKHNFAPDAPHHTSKGLAEPGNASRGRGASAMNNAGRLVYTLSTMSPDEAKAFGIDERDRREFIRLDSGKVNVTRHLRGAKWFRLIGVRLGNETELYPNGDEVQTVEPWSPPETWADLDCELINRILSDIDAGLEGGRRYSDSPNAQARAAWKVIIKHVPRKTEAQAREIIRAWVKNGLLVAEDYLDPDRREEVPGLKVDPAKRPGTEV